MRLRCPLQLLRCPKRLLHQQRAQWAQRHRWREVRFRCTLEEEGEWRESLGRWYHEMFRAEVKTQRLQPCCAVLHSFALWL
jgi:hypothetical protein